MDGTLDWTSVVTEQDLLELAGSVHELRHEHAMVHVDGEGAEIKELVVQRAERQSIGLGVRAAGLMPLDVRRVQANGRVGGPSER